MKMGSNYIVVTMKQGANHLRCASVSDVDDEWRRGYEEDDGSKNRLVERDFLPQKSPPANQLPACWNRPPTG